MNFKKTLKNLISSFSHSSTIHRAQYKIHLWTIENFVQTWIGWSNEILLQVFELFFWRCSYFCCCCCYCCLKQLQHKYFIVLSRLIAVCETLMATWIINCLHFLEYEYEYKWSLSSLIQSTLLWPVINIRSLPYGFQIECVDMLLTYSLSLRNWTSNSIHPTRTHKIYFSLYNFRKW